MDILLVLLRLLHIVAAFLWFGVGVAQTYLVVPAIQAAGESGLRFAKAYTSQRLGAMIMPAAAGITMLAGILLYLVGNATSHFSQTGNIVLGLGAVFGIIAGIHGGAVTGRASSAFADALKQNVPDQPTQSISADGLTAIRAAAMKLGTDARISLVLTVVALICMGSARYL